MGINFSELLTILKHSETIAVPKGVFQFSILHNICKTNASPTVSSEVRS